MRSFRDRLRLLVERSRGRHQLLHMALDALPPGADHISFDWPITPREANHVLRLLFRNRQREIGRSGPRSLEGPWPVGDTFTRPLPGDSATLGDCTSPAARHSD